MLGTDSRRWQLAMESKKAEQKHFAGRGLDFSHCSLHKHESQVPVETGRGEMLGRWPCNQSGLCGEVPPSHLAVVLPKPGLHFPIFRSFSNSTSTLSA